jgi:hypothetical protein
VTPASSSASFPTLCIDDSVLQSYLRSVVAERNRLARELRKTQTKCNKLEEKAQRLKREVDRLKGKLEESARAAKRQAAPFSKGRREKDPKPPGRPRGHAAARRPVPDHIDEDVYESLTSCPRCHGPVTDIKDLAPQIVCDLDAPPHPRCRVRRFHNQSGYCAHCRRRVQSRHPDQCSTARGAAGVQLGPRLISLAIDLHTRMGVPYRKLSGIFAVLFGLVVSPAAWARAARRVARRLEPTYRSLVTAARQAAVTHIDETGWYITWADKRPWLHVFSVPALGLTLFAVRLSRGRDVALEILGRDYSGTVGIDGWAAYIKLPWRKGQCTGHLLRRCAEMLEVQKRGAARFPLGVQRVLRDGVQIKRLLPELTPEEGGAMIDQVRGELRQLLSGRIKEPANLRLANHLRRHEDEIFTHLEVPGLGATNNEAEREIRPAVVLRKIAAGNHNGAGAHDHEVIASVGRTAERNGCPLPLMLPDLLRSPDPECIVPVLGNRPMPPPVPLLPGWKELVDHANCGCVRRTSRGVDRKTRGAARSPPP